MSAVKFCFVSIFPTEQFESFLGAVHGYQSACCCYGCRTYCGLLSNPNSFFYTAQLNFCDYHLH